MNATREGSGVRVNLGINPRVVADLYRDWSAAVEAARRAHANKALTDTDRRRYDDLAADYARDLHDACNPLIGNGDAWELRTQLLSAACDPEERAS